MIAIARMRGGEMMRDAERGKLAARIRRAQADGADTDGTDGARTGDPDAADGNGKVRRR